MARWTKSEQSPQSRMTEGLQPDVLRLSTAGCTADVGKCRVRGKSLAPQKIAVSCISLRCFVEAAIGETKSHLTYVSPRADVIEEASYMIQRTFPIYVRSQGFQGSRHPPATPRILEMNAPFPPSFTHLICAEFLFISKSHPPGYEDQSSNGLQSNLMAGDFLPSIEG